MSPVPCSPTPTLLAWYVVWFHCGWSLYRFQGKLTSIREAWCQESLWWVHDEHLTSKGYPHGQIMQKESEPDGWSSSLTSHRRLCFLWSRGLSWQCEGILIPWVFSTLCGGKGPMTCIRGALRLGCCPSLSNRISRERALNFPLHSSERIPSYS